MNNSAALDLLHGAIQASNATVKAGAEQKIIDYLNLLAQWNAVHNLSGHAGLRAWIAIDVIDSLQCLFTLQHTPASSNACNVVDLGSGNGFPAIILACCSDMQIFCIERRQKKAAFLRHVIMALQLTNAKVFATDCQLFQPSVQIDALVTRAFGNFNDIIAASQHFMQHATYVCIKSDSIQNQQQQHMAQHLMATHVVNNIRTQSRHNLLHTFQLPVA